MNLARTLVVCLAVSVAPMAMAQKWEFGGGAGGAFNTSKDLTRPTETATANIKTGVAASAITNAMARKTDILASLPRTLFGKAYHRDRELRRCVDIS